MKARRSHIAYSSLLIGALLFAQIGVNFFHRNHDVHENKSISAPLKAGKAAVQKHGEHCKVCSIDCFNHAFVHNESFVKICSAFADHKSDHAPLFVISLPTCSQGRAPPLS